MISAIDLNTHVSSGKIRTYVAGHPIMVARLFGTTEVLIPDCDEAHEIAGGWLIDGIALMPKVVSIVTKKIINMTEYGHIGDHYNAPPPVYFVEVPGWELIVEQNVFTHNVTLYFRRKNQCN